MRRVLVTGATGGLGLSLVTALRRKGYVVRATGRSRASEAKLAATGAEFVAADLNAPAATDSLCQGMDSVIHAAALSSPWGRDRDFRRVNVEATQSLLAAARRAGCQRFVFVSSPSVYARPRDQFGLTESDPLPAHFLNAYAATKAEAERRVRTAADDVIATVCIRPRAIIGPDDTVLLPRFLRVIEKGVFPLVRGGAALIELTDVRDVANALILAETRAPALSGQVFNVSGGQAVTIRATVEALAEALGRPLRFVDLPFTPLRLATAGMEAVAHALPGRPEPPLTVYSLCTLAFSQTFDLTRARTQFGFTPHHDGLASAIAVARGARS
jgi:nucleoside-diphosphate-sugar epimerase